MDLPHIPPVVEKDCLVVLEISRDSEAGHLLTRWRHVEVHELRRNVFGDVARLTGTEVVAEVVRTLEPDDVAAARACRPWAREPVFDQLPGARRHVDCVKIEELLAKHRALVVRALVQAQNVPATLDHPRDLGEVVPELYEAILVGIPGGEEVHAPELLLADTLLRHGVDIQRVPDLHSWRIVFFFVGIGLFVTCLIWVLPVLFPLLIFFVFGRLPIRVRPPLLYADEEHRPVFGPRGAAELDHTHGLREVAVSAGIESEALVIVLVEIPPRQRDVGCVLKCLVLERLQDREVGRLVPPRESPVRCGVGVERADLPAVWIINGDGVADLPVRVDGEREQVTLVLPRKRRDISEAHLSACRHRPHDDIDAVALLVLRLVASNGEIRPVVGERERLDVFDLLLFAGQ